MNEELTMLPVADIYPHPDNPRKDVGDVTELADQTERGIVMTIEDLWKVYQERRNKYNLNLRYREDRHGCNIKITQRRGTTERLVISRESDDREQCKERAAADLLFLFPEV